MPQKNQMKLGTLKFQSKNNLTIVAPQIQKYQFIQKLSPKELKQLDQDSKRHVLKSWNFVSWMKDQQFKQEKLAQEIKIIRNDHRQTTSLDRAQKINAYIESQHFGQISPKKSQLDFILYYLERTDGKINKIKQMKMKDPEMDKCMKDILNQGKCKLTEQSQLNSAVDRFLTQEDTNRDYIQSPINYIQQFKKGIQKRLDYDKQFQQRKIIFE